ncbi:MAG: alpha/beta hydrolase [Sphingomonadales bacterium 32-68-7]|nr:MAG: alpha/beta hydrolase [Sphingomonadales bacterium 12-68-11]OYX09996.1 MAG: alpha/beta hydrolase [Sphingomonadales bacterium 32-68-7]
MILKTLVTAAAATVLAGTAHAQSSQTPPEGARNVVLVHGAFADGAGWRGVYDELTAKGYRVSVVQNPLTSLADDVAATQRVLARQDGPTILVGHSWGGTVITQAGNDPKVVGLVYVAAFLPDAGESTADQLAKIPPPPNFVVDPQPDGFGFINSEKFKAGFAADTTDADAAYLRDSQVPIALAAFADKVAVAAWRTRPSWAVIPSEDGAIDPRLLRQMAERAGAQATEVGGASHVVFLTQPKAVAAVIESAARAAR